MRKLLATLFLSLCAVSAQKFEFWPGAQYDPAIPTISKTLGYEPATRIAPPADLVRYFHALAAAAPGRMKVQEYARSWEGRPLIYAIISSEENMKKLEQIRAAQLRLADPRKTSAEEARKIMATLPTILDLSYGVHGNEISSPDAAMLTAYHLLAARGDKMTDGILKNVIVLIDPSQNPDGRERFVHNFTFASGLEPDENPSSAEHQEPWPNGRSNHYLFDMNRDWHAITQPETLGRIRFLRDWLPHVQVDLHEMGSNSTYFFTPGSLPMNPFLTPDQKKQMALFGVNNAKWFDKFGWPYFTREVFDEFYPGYGASWPWFYGGMGMTFENASVRGLVVRRSDDSLYGYQESVQKHFVASIATCETALIHREKLLDAFWRYQTSAMDEAQKSAVKEYILPRRGDVSAVDKLAHILAEHGIEIRQAQAEFTSGGKSYPAGSYTVAMAQPRNRFIRVLLDDDVPMEKDFLKEQERRRGKKLSPEIYDVTGWSLPLMFGVECVGAKEVSQGGFNAISGPYVAKGSVSGRAEVAYLVPWGSLASGRFLTAALRANLKVFTANKSFTQGTKKYPSGTLILLVKQNAADLHDKVARIAAASGAEVSAANSSWVDDGINFGSNNVTPVKKPAVAMLWDAPTSSASAGQTRFVLERQYGYPVTVVRVSALMMADLSKFDVLIVPDSFGSGGAAYQTAIAPPVVDRLRNWVRSGGVLIGLGNAVAYLSGPQVGLLAVQMEGIARPADPAKPAAPAAAAPASGPTPPPAGKILAKSDDYQKSIQADSELPDAVEGVLVRAKVDPEHWLTCGLPETLNVLVSGRAIFTPIKRDRGINAVVFAPAEELVASGYMWEENRKQLAYKPFALVQNEGRGAVIGFTADPNFRAYMDGLNTLFLNAVFRFSTPAGRGGELQ